MLHAELLLDIILTTLKPQLKNVTAEDVTASLYYIHLNTDDDARLLAEESGELSSTPIPALQKPLPRKPLPESAKLSLDLSRPLPTDLVPSAPQPMRKPVAGASLHSNQTMLNPAQIVVPPSPIERRPLGPRPLPSEPVLPRKPLLNAENVAVSATSWTQEQDSVQSTKLSSESSKDLLPGDQSHKDPVFSRQSSDNFSITLIRRDPSSSAQWNVGTIIGSPEDNEKTMASRRLKKPYYTISIHLTTPGYNQFRLSQLSSDLANSHVNRSHNQSPSVPFTETGFHRQIRMKDRSFWGRPAMQHKRGHSDAPSLLSITRAFSNLGNDVSDALTENAEVYDSQDSGYMFKSPWGGYCKFTTGISGRSLKCKHSLPAPISAGGSGTSSSAVVVSELRFNLPSSGGLFKLSPDSSSKKKSDRHLRGLSMPKLGNLRDRMSPYKEQVSKPQLPPRPDPTSYAALYPSDDEDIVPLPSRPEQRYGDGRSSSNMSRVGQPSYNDSSLSDEEDRLDLSIGQEKAGGGNRGKRAKLGKLIILDEGFKMLDLVVAANMSVWWSVWESDQQ